MVLGGFEWFGALDRGTELGYIIFIKVGKIKVDSFAQLVPQVVIVFTGWLCTTSK